MARFFFYGKVIVKNLDGEKHEIEIDGLLETNDFSSVVMAGIKHDARTAALQGGWAEVTSVTLVNVVPLPVEEKAGE